jgi:hypothetical protein
VPVGGEDRHVHPEFGDEVLRRPGVDARGRVEPRRLGLVGCHLRGDQGIQLRNRPVQVLHVRELLPEQGPQDRGAPPREGRHELLPLLAEPPLRPAGQSGGVGLPPHQRGQHGAARDAQDVRGHGAQLEVRRL